MKLSVLLVEDSLADQRALRRALEKDTETRWEVELANTAEEALERLRHAPLPDALVLDFHLPGMDGVALLRTLREQCEERLPAVVVFTGSGSERVAVEAMKSGAHDYLLKDGFSPERLRHSLRTAVESVRMIRELEEHRRQAERAERAAREALAVRDEFFAIATHDLKGPLQSILLSTQLLRRQLPAEANTPGVNARLEQILRGTQRMGELIDHFLEVTRGGERPLRREPVDLFALVRTKVRELAPLASTHPVRLHVEGTDFVGRWDGGSLERVLDNLLGNAVKYSPRGGTIDVWLREESPGPEGWVRLCVQDQGMGIPAEDLPHIFERFRRGRNVAPVISGSGVGLASAHRLVLLHGGTLTVESEEGKGSSFTVRLQRGLSVRASSPEPSA
ncbi:hybrid sensor histidine kinase/response regulator [Vitiosangium sp. GDMCC 1.1324]|uniref:hybrid sensor histidine kinase/response regulator n=1 Tax=Vitiosangium sp. (strain GDMCC 1.1324) TaxID=2138576 RepID=UPI000D347011|nr:hybrid sensor histidine kinase/response regulator [Vitiosangium sp. GDMCC 1.1324]PTL81813.1 hybrid sensor histidine kinase/response regulator [Vitiosangium sp. GDMCC 1.1324]